MSPIAAAVSASNRRLQADRGQREVDDEDRHEDREPAPDLDVGRMTAAQRQEPDREERPQRDADERAADERDRRDLQGVGGPPRTCSGDRADPVREGHLIAPPEGETRLDEPDQRRHRPDEDQVGDREDRERLDRLERQRLDLERGRRQLGVADDVHQRGVLEDADVRVDRRRQGDPAADRQRHVEERREPAEAEREPGLAIAGRDRLEAGAEVLGVERAAPDHHREPRDGERLEPDAGPRTDLLRQPVVEEEDLDEDRRVADHLDVDRGELADDRDPVRARGAEDEPDEEGSDDRDRRHLERSARPASELVASSSRTNDQVSERNGGEVERARSAVMDEEERPRSAAAPRLVRSLCSLRAHRRDVALA